MRTYLVIVAFVLGYCCQAQIPGYKGKKIVVSGEYLVLNSPRNYNKNFDQGLFFIRSIAGANADYVIGRNVSFGLGVNFFKTGVLHESYVKEYYGSGEYDYSAYYANTFYHMLGREVSVYWKFFKYQSRGSLAPLGFYNQLGLHGGILKNKLIAGYQSNEDKQAKLSYGMVSYTIGFRNIYFKRLVTDFGIRLAAPFFQSLPAALGISQAGQDQYGYKTLEADMGKRLLGQQVVNVKVGLGLLF